MSFSFRKKRPFENISRNLRKLIKSEYYDRLGGRVNGAPRIDTFSQEFVPILTRWSFEAILRLCTEHGIFSALKGGRTVKELLFDLEWKNEAMLEDLLDTLVDHEVLRKQQREYRPLAISEGTGAVTATKLAELSLKDTEKQWIAQSPDYRPLFSVYNKLLSSHVLESLVTGSPTATLRGPEQSQLCTIFDSIFKTPAYVIPRMAAVAAGVTRREPKTILDLNCSTGRGIEEILLCQPDTNLILGVDSNAHQIEIAKRNVEVAYATNGIQERPVSFQTVDYSKPLKDQLREFSEPFDMILVDQFPMWTPKESHAVFVREIWDLLRPDGVIALYQPLRPSSPIPWPDEWILRVLDDFSGCPTESEFLDLFKQRPVGASNSISTKCQTVIPILAYTIYT